MEKMSFLVKHAETCYECLRGENKQKLEVLSFEKAWDKIEKDIILMCFSPILADKESVGKIEVTSIFGVSY